VCGRVFVEKRMINEGEGKKIWLMDFIYLMKWNNETSCNWFKWGGEEVVG
jgi:hypothetical protein